MMKISQHVIVAVLCVLVIAFLCGFICARLISDKAGASSASIVVNSFLGQGFAKPIVVEGRLWNTSSNGCKGVGDSCPYLLEPMVVNGKKIKVEHVIPADYFAASLFEESKGLQDGTMITVLGYETFQVIGVPDAICDFTSEMPQSRGWSINRHFVIVKKSQVGGGFEGSLK